MLLVFRTVCSTDWKGRPSHRLTLVAKTENREMAIAAMNKDISEWIAYDIVAEEYEEYEGTESEKDWNMRRVTELLATKTSTELLGMWRRQGRYEMKLQNKDHREFVERMDGSFCTTVYHILTEDYKSEIESLE